MDRNTELPTTPAVMSINQHDPSGGSGLAADIATLCSLGCHCTPVISRICVSDTGREQDQQSIDTALLIEQVRAILEDIDLEWLKLGDLGSDSNVEAIHTILNDYRKLSVVLAPPTNTSEARLDRLLNLLLPYSRIAVLSQQQVKQLAPTSDNLSACAQEILESGCEYLLVTDSHCSNNTLCNRLYSFRGQLKQYPWQRLPQHYHGANATLSAALSAYLAHGLTLEECVQQAQQFTWCSLKHAFRIGMGEPIPDRMHWSKK